MLCCYYVLEFGVANTTIDTVCQLRYTANRDMFLFFGYTMKHQIAELVVFLAVDTGLFRYCFMCLHPCQIPGFINAKFSILPLPCTPCPFYH